MLFSIEHKNLRVHGNPTGLSKGRMNVYVKQGLVRADYLCPAGLSKSRICRAEQEQNSRAKHAKTECKGRMSSRPGQNASI
jgi:hypothetical protein